MSDPTEFNVVDPFNDNIVIGKMYRSANTKYGALEIETVNGVPCPQFIWATPKMHYPIEPDGQLRIPDYDKIFAYEKIDGTNVLAFSYCDADGKEYISYKTRQVPFIQKMNKYGDFFSMWNEILERYPDIPDLVRKNRCSMAYELYGKRNLILVEYENSLDIFLLYGVNFGNILIPESLDHGSVTICPRLKEFQRMDEQTFIDSYRQMEKWLDDNLKVEFDEESEEQKIKRILPGSMEGAMWYLVNGNVAKQFKVKPRLIFDHCRSNKIGIPTHSIIITIKNSFEMTDEPTLDTIREMLLEEFGEADVEKSVNRIIKLLSRLVGEKKLQDQIVKDYLDHRFDIKNSKGQCMRWFGTNYDKRYAAFIFNHLYRQFS